MAFQADALMETYRKFKPHLTMVLVQLSYTSSYFLTEASFKHGLHPHVYVTYRNTIAGLVMLPFAYFLERKSRPKITIALSMEIFFISLIGLGLSPNMYFASLRYTSPTFISSMFNTISCLTFVMAIILRLEDLDVRSPRHIAKIVGTAVSLTGIMIMTLYKGSILRNIGHPLIHYTGSTTSHENWLKGPILGVMSCLAWSVWYIMQAYTLKKYPAQLSLTTCMTLIGGAQSAVVALIIDHKGTSWIVGCDINLWSIVYGGVVACAFCVFANLWCMEERGPVFVTMFSPLTTVLVAVLAYFVLGEKLYTGSITGGVFVIVGLYLLLWGKEGDHEARVKSREQSNLSHA